MAESVDDSFLAANEAIAALKKTRPRNTGEARARAVELSRLHSILNAAAKDVALGKARARVENGNGGAKPPVVATALNGEVLTELARGLVPFLKEILDPLKARIAELEQRPLLEDGGTWKAETLFRPNQVVTYRGGAWVCKEPSTSVRPGTSGVWRLMHKTVGGGRDDH